MSSPRDDRPVPVNTELLDALQDCIAQACSLTDSDGVEYDSMALSAYADGLRILSKYGRVRITNDVGRRVIAVPVPPGPDPDNHRWGQSRDPLEPSTAELWRTSPWRTGRSLVRTLYLQVGAEASSDDRLIGLMDHAVMAEHVVALHNAALPGTEEG